MLNALIAKLLPIVPKPIVRAVAGRYIAGATVEHAVQTVRQLNAEGAKTTIDVLGEFVESRKQSLEETEMSLLTLDAIHQHNLQSGLSIKPTSLGLGIDEEFCYGNVRRVLERAAQYGRFVRIDMENSPYTTKTLDLYRKLRADGFENTGVVIQAYMRRSEEDIRSLVPLNASVRLCKGIYIEPQEIAYKGREEVQENYKRLLVQLFDNKMYVGIATHDDVLIDFARQYIEKNAISRNRYEFQMLMGVRDEKRRELLREGHALRVYVPYGSDWYGYSVRRLKENPQVAGHIFKAMFTGGR